MVKKFLKFLVAVLIIALFITIVSKHYTANIIKKSVAKAIAFDGKNVRLSIEATSKNMDGTVRKVEKLERVYYEGYFVSKGEQNSIYTDPNDKLYLICSKKNDGKEIYVISTHIHMLQTKISNCFPIIYRDAETLYSWDDEFPVAMNLSKLLFTPTFTKSISENGREYYLIETKEVNLWIDKGDYSLYKYTENIPTTAYETGEQFTYEYVFKYDDNVTAESVEWPDLTGQDVMFI